MSKMLSRIVGSCTKCYGDVKLRDAVEAFGLIHHRRCVGNVRGAKAVFECVKCQNEGQHDGDHVMEGQE